MVLYTYKSTYQYRASTSRLTHGTSRLTLTSNTYCAILKPFWFPPLWVLHMMCIAPTFLMSLLAWLVLGRGWLPQENVDFLFYLAQLGLTLAWYPIILLKSCFAWAVFLAIDIRENRDR
ncbi:hypothetical protein K2173_026275 [Erythroxylum novogranatense]|uniref:Uncharacterized protein n=1 Tax=Erythroxylum novogranatense TaxID=1862640 RepID=A0AAV8SC85_9ROSI|nr:hypothetical protein K2173_026275 [Erythroxylum novogranatense]